MQHYFNIQEAILGIEFLENVKYKQLHWEIIVYEDPFFHHCKTVTILIVI